VRFPPAFTAPLLCAGAGGWSPRCMEGDERIVVMGTGGLRTSLKARGRLHQPGL
jgi:D-arabinose 1-dehydrogenase-like Zn-dependent alcohol dehydrogenase